MHPIQRQFAQRLRLLREERGLTQQALATACGWTTQKISLYERCARSPGLTDLAQIAEVLGVRPSELIGDPEEAEDPLERELQAIRTLLRAQPIEVVRTVVKLTRAFVAQPAS